MVRFRFSLVKTFPGEKHRASALTGACFFLYNRYTRPPQGGAAGRDPRAPRALRT